ncbi:hypothetical protein [Bradyrhizobium sp. AUGA SZCCT0431]|uniref:hypothetical protein n=1 Tax=Bradyrhizobium sp. AUGA SZCCT0431 TaxID=2807674 RepID=UPI001BA50342|nr:hypothetical protein [Bradyrhizobium sp. AUGA SZCCT0431]MBR1145227.1 hypothetical protein [Bradyrhizobium sp. AUGA SZCCT0431]
MFGTTRGMLLPARKHLFAVTLAVIAISPLAASADPAMLDVRTLPRLEGAVEQTALTMTYLTKAYQVTYDVPAGFGVAAAAATQLLAADGWVQYARPLENDKFSSKFKKGRQGLVVSVPPGKQPNQSSVIYSANTAHVNVPFPPDATDILFDEWRPYLGCIAPTTFDATLAFFRKEMEASGWKPLKAADAAERWPNAQLSETIENGVRVYYSHDFDNGFHRQPPVMLTLQRRDDGRTGVEIRVAPFAMPETIEAGDDVADLPMPKKVMAARSSGDSNSVRRELDVGVVAEIPAMLAFYRRELAARNWTETSGAVVSADNAMLNFSSAEQTATLDFSRRYDLTVVNFVTHMKESVLAAPAKAKKEAEAAQAAKVAQAANLSDAPLQALADNSKPVPLPENAEKMEFDGDIGRLTFESSSSVRLLAAFYSSSMKSQGWKEGHSVIHPPMMAMMEFSKGAKSISFTVMRMGLKVSVTAYGSGLEMANAKPGAAGGRATGGAATKAAVQDLENDPDAPFPVPKQHSAMNTSASGKLPGSNAVYRRQLDASIPAELSAVLAFYRRELGKREWKELAERAVVKADRVELAYTSPDGPALLKLGRSEDETSVSLVQKYPDVAAKADMMPRPGQARLMLGNLGGSEAAVTINKQTIKVAAGAGGLQSPRPPVLELAPGKYRYSVKVAGHATRNDTIEVTADDAWALIIPPSGEALSLQMY